MKAPISVCLIARNEGPRVERCLRSFRDYVEEINFVDTGSTDNTIDEARKYADKVVSYTQCNNPQTGLIEDFSMARNYSFSLASPNLWTFWVDLDDVVQGAQYFDEIVKEYEQLRNGHPVFIMFPYEYAHDAAGKCTLRHYRERLLNPASSFSWLNPVHEVLVPKEASQVYQYRSDKITVIHRRQTKIITEPTRNLRILKAYYDKVGDSDPRQLYYLGLEYCNTGDIDNAIKFLEKYTTITGWDDEKCMALMKLCDIYLSRADYMSVIDCAYRALRTKEHWGEPYFYLAKAYYFLASAGNNPAKHWLLCAQFAKFGLSLPPTDTVLFVNPIERQVEIHRYYNVALNNLGRVSEAADSVNEAIKFAPNDAALLSNKNLYDKHLARQKLNDNLQELVKLDALKIENVENIKNILDGKATNEIPPNINLTEVKQRLQSDPTYVHKIKDVSDSNKLDIVFFCGDGIETWTPDTVKKAGIGGSELMAMHLSQRLAALGHQVRLYNSCGNQEGTYNGVQYLQTQKFHNLQCDVLIVSRQASMLADHLNIRAKLKLLWVHDVWALGATNELLLKADRILALSEWHKQNLVEHHNLHPNHILVTRNGIDLKRFEKPITKNRFKCICSSSPDRYLPVLLDIWPRIKEQVPRAELNIFYGFHNWCAVAQNDHKQLDLITHLLAKLKAMEPLGVKYYERVNQEQLAEEFLSSGAWIYSTWFSETFCISAAEAQAAGCRMITSNIAALKETVGNRGVLLDGDWVSKDYQDKFVESVVGALSYEDNSDRLQLQEYAKEHFCLDKLAKEWEKMFFNLIKEMTTNPIVPYYPTKSYQ